MLPNRKRVQCVLGPLLAQSEAIAHRQRVTRVIIVACQYFKNNHERAFARLLCDPKCPRQWRTHLAGVIGVLPSLRPGEKHCPSSVSDQVMSSTTPERIRHR